MIMIIIIIAEDVGKVGNQRPTECFPFICRGLPVNLTCCNGFYHSELLPVKVILSRNGEGECLETLFVFLPHTRNTRLHCNRPVSHTQQEANSKHPSIIPVTLFLTVLLYQKIEHFSLFGLETCTAEKVLESNRENLQLCVVVQIISIFQVVRHTVKLGVFCFHRNTKGWRVGGTSDETKSTSIVLEWQTCQRSQVLNGPKTISIWGKLIKWFV